MQFFSWVAQNWQPICSWVAGLYLLYRVGLVLASVVSFFHDASARVQTAESLLLNLSSNHLTHIQSGIEDIGKTLAELREDLRMMLYSKIGDHE